MKTLHHEGFPSENSTPHGRHLLADILGSPFFWRGLLPVFDAFLAFTCMALLAMQRFSRGWGEFLTSNTITSLLVFISCILLGASVSGAYRKPSSLRTLNAAAEFILGTVLATLAAMFVIYVVFFGKSQHVAQESRSVILVSSMLFTPLALTVRLLIEHLLQKVAHSRPYLLIGRPKSLSDFRETYKFTGLPNPTVSLPLINTSDGKSDLSPHTGSPMFWNEVGRNFEGIILSEPPDVMGSQLIDRLVRMHFSELPVYTLNSFYAKAWRQVPTLNLNASWVFEQDFSLAERSYYRFVKRLFDTLLSFALLAAASPLMLVVAFLIKRESTGSVFYRQPRVGQNRTVFQILKFRTMLDKSDVVANFKGVDEDRVTKVGRILRKLRIDELPQLINVLKGEMSLIGPRPEWTKLVERYEQEIPFYHLRHLVKPGITGWAQLNIEHGATVRGTLEKLRYDLYYIQFYSPVLDFEILLKTMLHVVSFKGH